MRKTINKNHVEGRIYECDLEVKVSKKGVTYIGGKIDVATDEAGLNVVTVFYNYVPTHYSNGNENKTYAALYPLAVQKDKDGNVTKPSSAKTIMANAGEVPTMVRLDPSIALKEWYKNENGEDVLISTQRPEGGFAHVVTSLNADESLRNTFEADMVITSTRLIEADPDKQGSEDRLIVRGAIFDFFKNLLPVEFAVANPKGIEYFENLDATQANPVFTKVWGKMVSNTIVTTIEEESAFGESVVKEVKKTRKEWLITGTSTVPYEFDSEGDITAAEFQEAIANRNVALAKQLAEQKEREAAKAGGNNAFGAPVLTPAAGNFNF